MSLRGFSKGKSQAEIVKAARNYAGIYYNTECLEIKLSNEREEGIWICDKDPKTSYVVFSADWTAEERHAWITRTDEPDKCMICKREGL